MKNLIKTIFSIFSSKTRKLNRSMQISNCVDLVEDQQYKFAQGYKMIVKSINELHVKINDLKKKIENTDKPELKAVFEKNLEIMNSTVERLTKNKETIASKLQKAEDSRILLKAKKNLLDSIESIKDMSTNIFTNENFDIDVVMSEIDKSIQDIESEFQADDELNALIK